MVSEVESGGLNSNRDNLLEGTAVAFQPLDCRFQIQALALSPVLGRS